MRFMIFLTVVSFMLAGSVELQTAERVAVNFLDTGSPVLRETLADESGVLAYIFTDGSGYIITSANTDIQPVIAWSRNSRYEHDDNPLRDLVLADMRCRQANIANLPRQLREEHRQCWQKLVEGKSHSLTAYYPPEGTTESGGWMESEWNQGNPFNRMCPRDPVGELRSYVGCPAVAMGQILNYHRTTNGMRLTDSDDYFHNWGTRRYHIDDDWEDRGFPSFPTLNVILDTLDMYYADEVDPTTNQIAALLFACGVTMQQVYSSDGSGTFGVSQAYSGYQRFGLFESTLLEEDTPLLYTNIQENIMDGFPVHFAVVTPAWDSGHNVVVDGWNTDDFYHLNFGWGGSYDGWYSLPDDIPYGLTVIEGVVVNIFPESGSVAETKLPTAFSLTAHPNPFNSACQIDIPQGFTAAIYDVHGRSVHALPTGSSIWNADGQSSGVYLVRAQRGDAVVEKQVVLVR